MITVETINRIVGFRGNGLPVVSLYVGVPTDPPNRGVLVRSQVDSQLHEIRPMGEDCALGRDAMMSIRGDIDRITGVAAEERWLPGAVGRRHLFGGSCDVHARRDHGACPCNR
jgi:peptide chain release factor subunit 1